MNSSGGPSFGAQGDWVPQHSKASGERLRLRFGGISETDSGPRDRNSLEGAWRSTGPERQNVGCAPARGRHQTIAVARTQSPEALRNFGEFRPVRPVSVCRVIRSTSWRPIGSSSPSVRHRIVGEAKKFHH